MVGALAGRGVSPREYEVLVAVAERLSNAEIAARLGLRERTVESHVSSLLRKLGVPGRRNLARFAPTVAGTPRPVSTAVRELPLPLQRLCKDGPWFGRQAESSELLALWEAAAETRLVLVRGESGIGKSRLVAEFAAEIHRRGGAVAFGACVDGPQLPFEPFVAGLSSAGMTVDDDPALRRLVAPRIAAMHDVVDPERSRLALQAALFDTMVCIARPAGLLLIVEDLHWASESTREVLEMIARTPRRGRLLVIATTRDEGVAPDQYGAYLGRLDRSPSVTTLPLGGLDLNAATQLIDSAGSSLDPADGVARSGGNPLFLRQLARHGATSRSLGEAVAERFMRLNGDELDIADIAVACGDRIEIAVVATASGRSHGDVLDALERAEALGIMRGGDRPATFVFTHDVFRSGRYAALSASRRLRLHAAIAAALDRSNLREDRLATVAYHACLAGARFDPKRAVELSRRAGNVAMRAADHGAAAEHYRRALESMTLDPTSSDEEQLAVTIDLGESMMLSGDHDGEGLLRRAVQEARRRDDPVAVAAALAAMARVPGGYAAIILDQQFEAVLVDAIAALPASETMWRVRLLGNLGTHLYFTEDVDRGTALLSEAVDAARRTGDPVTLGRALMSYRWCGGPFEMDQRFAVGHELIELGERTGQDVFSMVGCQQLFWCHRQLGDRASMAKWDGAATRLVRGPDLEQLSQIVTVALLDGELDRADEVISEMARLEGANGIYSEGSRFVVDDVRGRLVGSDDLHAFIESRPRERSALEPFLARVLARTGQTEKATRLLDDIRARGYVPRTSNRWTTAMSCLAEAATLSRQVDVAADVGQLLDPLAGRWVDSGIAIWDTVDRARALCLLTVGEVAAAAELARAAADTSERQATPILRARELVVLAAAELVLGRPSDQLRREALAICHRTGARLIERDARLLLGTATVHDDAGLTLREREVIDHVALGETNRQIARALQISEATVRKHLEAAFKKLDVSTRTAAVARTSELRSLPRP